MTIQDNIDKAIAALEADIQDDTAELKRAEREFLDAQSRRDNVRNRLNRHKSDLEALRRWIAEEADARLAHGKALGRLRDKTRELCAAQGVSVPLANTEPAA